MTRTSSIAALLFVAAAPAQQATVLLDPARGGAESGARIADRLPEKQVTLDLAGRLAYLLRARGFVVAMTREGDVDVSNDARAALANNVRPVACVLLHATASGSGVHLYTSALHQKVATGSAVRWDEAQAAFVDRSHALAGDLKSALQRSRIAASSGETWMRPLDNMQCPAIAVEVAPEKDGTGAEDRTYQGQVANALANTLLLWRGKAQSLAPPEPAAPVAAPTTSTPAPQPAAPTQKAADAPVATPHPVGPKPTIPAPRPTPPADPDRTEP